MKSEGIVRRSYEESCKLLQQLGYLDAEDEDAIPPIPNHRPQYDDDEPLGVSFFRTLVGQEIEDGDEEANGGDLGNLTLPRTFFGRSSVQHVSFKNTDLSESTLCWNDFNDVNFTDAGLSACDLRGSNFIAVVFVRANLSNADLRNSSFEACDFTNAEMRGAKVTHRQGQAIDLSEEQRRDIDWQDNDGDEPPGG